MHLAWKRNLMLILKGNNFGKTYNFRITVRKVQLFYSVYHILHIGFSLCVIYDIQNRPFTHFRLILRVLVLLELFPFKMGIRGVLWQENVRGTRNASLVSDRNNVVVGVVFKCLRQRSNGLRRCLPEVFYMYVFSWFHSV
jgi:hypothetical protein